MTARIGGERHRSPCIIHRSEDVVARVREITEGRGVDVVYDGIGADMLLRSLARLKPFGLVASIGKAGGAIPPIDLSRVRAASISRPKVMAYMMDAAIYRAAAEEVLELAASGFPVAIGARFKVNDAARAHLDLEAGRTTGSIVLTP